MSNLTEHEKMALEALAKIADGSGTLTDPTCRRFAKEALQAIAALSAPDPQGAGNGWLEAIEERELSNIVQAELARFVNIDVGIALKAYIARRLASCPGVDDRWRNLALGLGERLAPRPDSYQDFTPDQFEAWLAKLPMDRDGGKQIGWAWKSGDLIFFSSLADKPRDGFPIYGDSPSHPHTDVTAAVKAYEDAIDIIEQSINGIAAVAIIRETISTLMESHS